MLKVISILSLLFSICLNASPIGNMGELKQDSDKVIYKDMLAYMEKSQNDTQLLTAGILYAMGISEPDSIGETLQPNAVKAERTILEAAKLGNKKANGILGSLLFNAPVMQSLDDKNHTKAQKYLELAIDSGDYEPSVSLINLYRETQQNKKLLNLAMKLDQNNDSVAQYILAFMFKDGFYSENGELLVQKDMRTANYYLTRACTNKNKDKIVSDFCSDPRNVEEDTNYGK